MEQDQSKLFVKDMIFETGELHFQTRWKDVHTQQQSQVKIFSKCIAVDSQYILYHFDLKFSITQQEIHFYLGEETFQFALEENNHLLLRSTLKNYLNQKGFHQQYKPIKKIGKGNFASVYLVEKLEGKMKYAVKAFSKEAAYSEENGKECLIKQIQIMRHLNNPHNMKLFEVFQSDNSLYVIFELLDGGQLYQKIKSKEKFKSKHIKIMVKGILEGLKEMHSKNVMHRDLKPENILLRSTDSYECVIADYGLAEFADSEEYLFVRCGTPGYVAPEVINIKDMKTKYSPICDMFSLGLIFHLLVFGKSIFKGKTYNEVLNENRSCTFSLDAPEYSTVDEDIMSLLKGLLKVKPEERMTAEQALSHPYFTKDQDEDEEEYKQEMKDSFTVDIGQSPILTTANEQRKNVKNLQRDSCVNFKMAKDNILTGKTQTVGTMDSGKISGFGSNLLKGLKLSKFTKSSETKENM